MITKIKTISNLAVFHDFKWDKEVCDADGKVLEFKEINIIYGRNYSGKTTLSRIIRSLETGVLSEKYEAPSFSLGFSDGVEVTQNDLRAHGKRIRVFNEDFVRENVRFIVDPDDCIESFAIFGEDNNRIEQEIEEIEKELGSNEVGSETGLYAKRLAARAEYKKAREDHAKVADALERQLSAKATDRTIGIKYKADRFGDQNYNIPKLKADIDTVIDESYAAPTDAQLEQYERSIAEKALQAAPKLQIPQLFLEGLINEAESLITRKISESDKIDDLVKDAILNHWVNEGRVHHKDKRESCAFCGNHIEADRWEKLEKHFDEESSTLEREIDALINQIEIEKQSAASNLLINKSLFYSAFHEKLEAVGQALKVAVSSYSVSLEVLISQLKDRKHDLLNPKCFQKPEDASGLLVNAWCEYEKIRAESEAFTGSLSKVQSEAKAALRMDEISKYLVTIGYFAQFLDIENKKGALVDLENKGKSISNEITQKEALILEKKKQLNDEEKGAIKVNEYLNHFFGHQFLSLSPISGEADKKIKFEVMRNGKKAYHLSEGECSLLAFCYFLAKLEDVDTKGSKPIIWIDDPISSLDSNHIFFVYSLISAEIAASGNFTQLFISTHNLDFLKYLRRLSGKYRGLNMKQIEYQKGYLLISRQGEYSTIKLMPRHLREYATEFNYLFHQIHKCAQIIDVDDANHTAFYNFGNCARKFLEIYLYYRYPDQGMTEETLVRFFGGEKIPYFLMERINNEYSHLSGVFERGATPIEVPEMQTAAKQIIERLKVEADQFSALMRSVGEPADEREKK